jgi:hypothetical protein
MSYEDCPRSYRLNLTQYVAVTASPPPREKKHPIIFISNNFHNIFKVCEQVIHFLAAVEFWELYNVIESSIYTTQSTSFVRICIGVASASAYSSLHCYV